jgi:hypothetical protein
MGVRENGFRELTDKGCPLDYGLRFELAAFRSILLTRSQTYPNYDNHRSTHVVAEELERSLTRFFAEYPYEPSSYRPANTRENSANIPSSIQGEYHIGY